MKTIYIIIDQDNKVKTRRFLSKVQISTGINQKTLSKHFNRSNEPYKNNEYTVYKSTDNDLKSFNRGNIDNFNPKVDD